MRMIRPPPYDVKTPPHEQPLPAIEPSTVPPGRPAPFTQSAASVSAADRAARCGKLATLAALGKPKWINALQACKADSGGAVALAAVYDPCADGIGPVCSHDHAYKVAYGSFYKPTTAPLTVKTFDLAPLAGVSTSPDSVLYVVYCSDAQCTSGLTMGINDDGNSGTSYPWDSQVVVTNAPVGWYRWVVTTYAHGSEGTTSVSTAYDATSVNVTGKVFGGYHVKPKELKVGDVLLVGKSNNGAGMPSLPDYHDTTLFVFSSTALNCAAACGVMLFNDDVAYGSGFPTRLSRIENAEFDYPQTHVIVGVYDDKDGAGNPYKANVRLLHHKRHHNDNGRWTHAGAIDNDGDGLTQEIEQGIESCDLLTDVPATGVGVRGMTCQAFGDLVNASVNVQKNNGAYCPQPATGGGPSECWHLEDSDNDGALDPWEGWAAAVACAQTPVSPHYDAGACAPISPADTPGCPTPYCATLAVSALSNPDPSVYDLFVLDFPRTCSGTHCTAEHSGASNTHSVVASQLSKLTDVWTSDPGTCWHGGPPPCTHPNDLPYRVQMHYYEGGTRSFPDDAFNWEVPGGAPLTFSYFNAWFGSYCTGPGLSCAGMRYTSVFRMSMEGHYGGGNVTSSNDRTMIWGNRAGDVPDNIADTFSHEVGHQLLLNHLQAGQGPNGASDCNLGHCIDGSCRCVGVDQSCTGSPNPPSIPTHNPMAASLMNYNYSLQRGMLPKSAVAPSPTAACLSGCSRGNLRFSKGLNTSIVESALNESTVQNSSGIKLAQDLFCFDEFNDAIDCSPFGTYVGSSCVAGAGVQCGPWCDGSNCYVNWDRTRAVQPPSPYSWDVSHGHFNAPEGGPCDQDLLADTNEWLAIVSRGKQTLTKTRSETFSIYQAVFNGGHANLAAWGFPVTVTADVAQSTYERNVCHTSSDCGSSACLTDACATGVECTYGPQQGCINGGCLCTADAHCRSGKCDLGLNRCETSRGGCACSSPADCVWESTSVAEASGTICNAATSVCATVRGADVKPATENFHKPWESAHFGGPGSVHSIRLTNTGPTSPIETISSRNEVRLIFALRWEDMAVGQTEQILYSSGSLVVTLGKVGSGGYLTARVPGSPNVLTFPGRFQGALLEPNRWYRVFVDLRTGGNFSLQVVAWHLDKATYDPGIPESGCVKRSWTSALPSTGDVWFGFDGSTDSTRLRGWLDDISLINWGQDLGALPATCEDEG